MAELKHHVEWASREPFGARVVVEASDLGIRPGEWPRSITVSFPDHGPVVYTLGRPEMNGLELAGWIYLGFNRESLGVLND